MIKTLALVLLSLMLLSCYRSSPPPKEFLLNYAEFNKYYQCSEVSKP